MKLFRTLALTVGAALLAAGPAQAAPTVVRIASHVSEFSPLHAQSKLFADEIGKRLPGQMGNKTVTVQYVKIVKLDLEKNLCMVLGSVPGAPDGYVMVRHAVKKLGKMGL